MIANAWSPSCPVVQEGLRGLARAHLRLVVVGRHVARRRHELAHLAVVRLLAAAVEEVRHVRVLLRLGDVQLGAAGVRDDRADRDLGVMRREHDREVPLLVVGGHRRVGVDHLGEPGRDLAHPVGAEVERQHVVARPDQRLLADRGRDDELVGLVALVPAARTAASPLSALVLGLALDEQREREIRAVPALVAVHRVVAARHGADAGAPARLGARRLDLRQRVGARRGRGVAAVREGVDHEIGHVELRPEPDQRLQMRLGGMHAAARHEADEMHALGALAAPPAASRSHPASRPGRPCRSGRGPAARSTRRPG